VPELEIPDDLFLLLQRIAQRQNRAVEHLIEEVLNLYIAKSNSQNPGAGDSNLSDKNSDQSTNL
jgi:hypothetical protein